VTPEPSGRIPSLLHAGLIWFTALIGLTVASIGVGVVAYAIVASRGGDPTAILADPERSPILNNPTWIALSTLANELAVAAVLGLWLLILKPSRQRVLPMTRPSPAGVAGSLLVVFGAAPAAEVVGELVHRVVQNEVTSSKVVIAAAQGASTPGFFGLLICLAVMPALIEEALFRGMLTPPFEKSFVAALIVPSVLFGIFHLEPTQVAGTILLGMAFALSRLCTGSLVACMLAHGIYNATVLSTVRWSDRVIDHEIRIGPVLVGIVAFSIGLALLLRERRRLREQSAAAAPTLGALV
jgi:membrane protease YdiL (CAAX protease family)